MKTVVHSALVLSWFALSICLFGCGSDALSGEGGGGTEGNRAPKAQANAQFSGCEFPEGLSSLVIDGIPVDVWAPSHPIVGDVLVLHPWNAARKDWCAKSMLCAIASERGFRLIMPEMGKSIYAQTVYPETREDWKDFPTLNWIKKTLIPELREQHCLLRIDGHNFAIGASSGARGALLLAEELPSLFVAVAGLSGDYNPSELRGDNIYRGYLGEFEQFPQRWEVAENVVEGCGNIRAAVYLSHGKADDMVSYKQTLHLYDQLKVKNPELNIRLNLPSEAGGDFAFWASEVNNFFDFFESMQATGPEGSIQ